jgi:K+-transporting ATPase A subunit
MNIKPSLEKKETNYNFQHKSGEREWESIHQTAQLTASKAEMDSWLTVSVTSATRFLCKNKFGNHFIDLLSL